MHFSVDTIRIAYMRDYPILVPVGLILILVLILTPLPSMQGIINRFRLSNAVDLNLELSATGLEGKFDGEHGGKPDYDGILGATLGVTYYFPTRGFQRPVPQIISELELNQMRNR